MVIVEQRRIRERSPGGRDGQHPGTVVSLVVWGVEWSWAIALQFTIVVCCFGTRTVALLGCNRWSFKDGNTW